MAAKWLLEQHEQSTYSGGSTKLEQHRAAAVCTDNSVSTGTKDIWCPVDLCLKADFPRRSSHVWKGLNSLSSLLSGSLCRIHIFSDLSPSLKFWLQLAKSQWRVCTCILPYTHKCIKVFSCRNQPNHLANANTSAPDHWGGLTFPPQCKGALLLEM